MEPFDDADNMEGDGSASNSLRTKIAELERRLGEEKERFEFLQLEACQEVEKYTRDHVSLRENVGRLEEDCAILRERELRDRDRMKGLMEEIERKERVFMEKFVELKLEIKDLECANIKAQDEACEWKKKYLELKEKTNLVKRVKEVENAELEARALRVVEESFRLLEKDNAEAENAKGRMGAIEVDEEMPKRSAGSMQKSCEEDWVLTPEPIEGVGSESEGDDEEDRIPIGQLVGMKPHVNVSDVPDEHYVPLVIQSAGCNDIGDSMKPMRKKLLPRKMRGKRKDGAEESFGRTGDAQIPLLPANKRRRVADKGVQAYRRNFNKQIAFSEKLHRAVRRAETLQSNLKSCNPSFIKPMVRSHVSGSFWLSLPREFCDKNLPSHELKMILEDEKGSECEVKYIGGKSGALSGGWRGFALYHNLELEDTLLFELREPTRFKVYIIKANQEESQDC